MIATSFRGIFYIKELSMKLQILELDNKLSM